MSSVIYSLATEKIFSIQITSLPLLTFPSNKKQVLQTGESVNYYQSLCVCIDIYWYNLSYNSWKKITMYTCIWQCRIHPIPANILLILFLDMTSNCSTHFSFRSLMAISCQWKRDTPQFNTQKPLSRVIPLC